MAPYQEDAHPLDVVFLRGWNQVVNEIFRDGCLNRGGIVPGFL